MVAAIIQARLGSTRLPKKCLKTILNKSLLEHIVFRIKKCKTIDTIIIATTELKEDDQIIDLAKKMNINYFRGQVNNVLDRYYNAAKNNSIDTIVRITADDPFKDPNIIDQIVGFYKKNSFDYVSNTIKPTYPIGIDVEVFSFLALEKAWNYANDSDDLEHVTLYILKNQNKFKVKNIKNKIDLSSLRWTIDTAEDFLMAKRVYEELYHNNKFFLMDDILELLKNNPDIAKINNNIKQKVFL